MPAQSFQVVDKAHFGLLCLFAFTQSAEKFFSV
jgi:hypothetical protein